MTGKYINLSFTNINKVAEALNYSVSEFIRLGEDGFTGSGNLNRELKLLQDDISTLNHQLKIQKNLNLCVIVDNQELKAKSLSLKNQVNYLLRKLSNKGDNHE